MKQIKCPKCDKIIVDNNSGEEGIVVKSRLVFLNDDGEILCRCCDCKNILSLPFLYRKSMMTIQEEFLIDL